MYTKNRFQNSNPLHFANLLEGFLNPDNYISEGRCSINVSSNILEHEDTYEIQLIAPGLSKEDFKLDIDKNLLTVSFEKKEENNTLKYLRKEFQTNSFKRSFNLGDKIDINNVQAKYQQGILSILLGKKVKEENKALSIEVQ